MNTREEIINIVSDYIALPSDKIDTTEGLKFTEGLDSFGVLSMIATIEEHFSTRIPDSKLKDFKTLDDIITYFERTAC